MTCTGAAELFRDGDAEQTELGKAAPELLVIGRCAFEHLADVLGGALFAQEAARLILDSTG